ncbi:Nucleotide-binding, alpha-beta plait, partial [Cynara cardunculus var. scolymus]
MGKNRKMKQDAGGGSQHSTATVFVNNMPYTFSNSQASFSLEETFSDVGPIRRCFMVTQKGSTEHRGFGFVQFAVTEDANRAIELKNGSSVGGRTIGVKHATHRAPLEQRRSKGNEGKVVKLKKAVTPLKTERVEDISPIKNLPSDSQEKGKIVKSKKAATPLKTERVEGVSSKKQRVARTVVIGGILNDDMAEDVHRLARECGPVSSITYPLPKDEIAHHGLLQDGCRLGASSIAYASVKLARACVAKLHQKTLKGGTVWARQFGGEGSKVQKWKLIIRNLPFQANVNEIREMFSTAGFVWDVFIPKKPDSGLSKGFAFVKFTCKQDAENAIQKLNGKSFGKRPIAVDWAVPKKIYTAGSQITIKDGQKESDEEDSSSDLEDDLVELDKNTQHSHGAAVVPDGSDSVEEEVNFDEEADVAKKVLNNFLSSLNEPTASVNGDIILPQRKQDEETINVHNKLSDGPTTVPHVSKPESLTKTENTNFKPAESEEDLQRTLFICNLPFDATTDEVKQRFSAFGEVQSFVPVLHPITKRPRGTGFLKFITMDAADAAFSAATAVTSLGIILKGRQLKVLKALNKKAAHDKEVEKTKKEEHDHRNLYLAKEGVILEGTPSAQGVSDSDMSKRRSLEQKKETKLQSPNFHVSRTRLIMYNVPKSMNEKQLKRLCIEAVTSRATKQKPTIRQIKLLKDSNKGKEISKNHSRGVAFIEFTEHQHALVALRVLNNNPETFTSEHRPIVEFALDNVQTLRQRNDKIEAQQHGFSNDAHGSGKNANFHKPVNQPNDESKKRKTRGPTKESRNDKTVETEGAASEGGKPAKKYKTPLKKLTDSKDQLAVQEEKRPNGRSAAMEGTTSGSARPTEIIKKRSRDPKEPQDEETGSMKRRKNRQNKDPLGQDTVDKLDILIEQYRSKFSGNRTDRNDGQKQGTRRLG